ncbi:hypothetical protein APE_1278 [Aeropyrum pernix K1]|uniref:Uncharacterized protein n=1 Tax=Aeropyrum pernix (strain ATCC 700893 / DSM 11879 / JCM 9820 / NBRC 100138 / K1) TaxID=272557 RepID=Q9YCH9_AERPE|nr:hypothetical protein [Aeropyrum pernix]BAA80269.1 hypothetical protein APE_1278 [Aeropyrum pernix K1]
MASRGALSYISALAGVLGFLLALGSLLLLGYVYTRASGAGTLVGVIVLAIYLALMVGMLVVGNILFFLSSFRGGRVSRVLTPPVIAVNLLWAFIAGANAMGSLRSGDTGAAAAAGLLLVFLVALTLYYVWRLRRV